MSAGRHPSPPKIRALPRSAMYQFQKIVSGDLSSPTGELLWNGNIKQKTLLSSEWLPSAMVIGLARLLYSKTLSLGQYIDSLHSSLYNRAILLLKQPPWIMPAVSNRTYFSSSFGRPMRRLMEFTLNTSPFRLLPLLIPFPLSFTSPDLLTCLFVFLHDLTIFLCCCPFVSVDDLSIYYTHPPHHLTDALSSINYAFTKFYPLDGFRLPVHTHCHLHG